MNFRSHICFGFRASNFLIWSFPVKIATNWLVFSLLGLLLLFSSCSRQNLQIVNLQCEYAENPLGLNDPYPRLSWELQSKKNGASQTAHPILIATSRHELEQDHGDLWDTGKIYSNRTAQIPYNGKPLNARQCAFWKVRVWDAVDKPSHWSHIAT